MGERRFVNGVPREHSPSKKRLLGSPCGREGTGGATGNTFSFIGAQTVEAGSVTSGGRKQRKDSSWPVGLGGNKKKKKRRKQSLVAKRKKERSVEPA